MIQSNPPPATPKKLTQNTRDLSKQEHCVCWGAEGEREEREKTDIQTFELFKPYVGKCDLQHPQAGGRGISYSNPQTTTTSNKSMIGSFYLLQEHC